MKIGMLFPGYGSQFVGMGKELYDESRSMQEYFEEASSCLAMNFVKLCFASSDLELSRGENAYPALFLVSSSIATLLKQEGIVPHLVAGYNTGEYAAIHTVQGISFPDGLYLLSKYQGWYQELLQNGSFAGLQVVGMPTLELQELCAQATTHTESVSIAVYDSPIQHTIMGHKEAVNRVVDILHDNDDADTDQEPLEIGLHSATMDPVAVNFKLHLEKVDIKDLTVPLITNADAKIVTHNDRVKSGLVKQIHSPILWHQSLLLFNECDLIIEIGPGTYLSTMAQAQFPHKKCVAINKRSDIEELKTYLEQHVQREE